MRVRCKRGGRREDVLGPSDSNQPREEATPTYGFPCTRLLLMCPVTLPASPSLTLACLCYFTFPYPALPLSTYLSPYPTLHVSLCLRFSFTALHPCHTIPPSLCHPASPYHPAFVPPHPASLKPSCHHHCTSQPQALTLVPRLPRSFHPNQRPRELVNVLSSQNWFRNDLYLLLLECKQSKNFKSCKW